MSDVANLYSFQWIWQGESQLAEDNFVNTWHFRKASGIVTDYDNVKDMLVDFYSAVPAGTGLAIKDFMCQSNLSGNFTVKAYHLTDPLPRTPAYEFSDSIELPTEIAMPTEVAAVMSFQAEPASGENQKRKRNRVYIGPFATGICGEYGHITPDLVETMLFAGKALFNASEGSANWHWNVYSPTDDEAYEVYNGWVDNAYDTQRRRGTRATARGYYDADLPT
jgi:hypothetical protein